MTRPQFQPRRHRADILLADWTQAQPWRADYWRAVDAIRARHDRIPWPRAVYLPLEEAGEVAAAAWRAHGRQPTPATIVREACELQILAAWRLTRGVYRYDPTLAEALRSTPLTGALPTDALTRLPEWCVYIETPGEQLPMADGRQADLLGCFAALDWVSATRRDPDDWTAAQSHYQLMLGMDLNVAGLAVANVPLVGTLEQAIEAVVDQWSANTDRLGVRSPSPAYADATRRYLPPLISRVLYLCADEADLGDRRPARPHPRRTKQGYRLFPAERLTTWDVGVRIGAAIRRAQETTAEEERDHTATGRARPRAHIRRAHWHSYWRGPRKADRDRQELVVRWLPPLPINVVDVDLPTTIHDVE